MTTDNPAKSVPPTRQKRGRLLLLALLVLASLWFLHPVIFAWTLRQGIVWGAGQIGLQVEVARVSASLTRPVVLEKIRLRAQKGPSATRAEIGHVEISLHGLWSIFFGPGRVFREIAVRDGRGAIDARTAVLPPLPPDISAEEQRAQARTLFCFLPQNISFENCDLEVLGDDQYYALENFSANFSEDFLGKFEVRNARVDLTGARTDLGGLAAVTAWKNGTAYLADLVLRSDVKIDSFSADLARPGGIALDLAAEIFGGSLRGGVAYGTAKGLLTVDSTVWISGVNLAPLPGLLGWKAKLDGVVREARLTFRGSPERMVEAEASLRVVADNVRWNERGWESLEAGANLIHRRLAVNDFDLRQKENRLSGNGEVLLAEGWESLSRAPFLLNLSGSIQDLGTLAGLVGPPFDEMTGRMSLNGSVNGSNGKMDGFLSIEASEIGYRERPVESAKIDVLFAGEEVQIARCEIWSGGDYLRAKGALGIHKPFRYSGEVEARAEDAAAYAALFRTPGAESVYAGALQARWQGDGTFSAHSGAFTLSLEDFISEFTPSGLTGRFTATYSPENLYFSNLELQHNDLIFSTRATAARSGLTLKDAVLRSGRRELADGEMFLPFDIFTLAGGLPWQKALNVDRPLYLNVASRGTLELGEVLALTGQDAPLSGSLRLKITAAGPVLQPALNGEIKGESLRVKAEADLPPSALDLALSTADSRATLAGKLETRGFAPLTLQAGMPFGFKRDDDGTLRWLNPDGQLDGAISLPRTELAVFRPFLPASARLGGVLSGGLTLGGTLAQPRLNGQLALAGGWLQTDPRAPRITNIETLLTFDAEKMTVARCQGDVAAGPAQISGSVNFADPANLRFDLALRGEKVLLARDESLRVRANVDLQARGDGNSGSVTGSVRLVDARIYRRLEITPLLVPSPLEEEIFVPPDFSGRTPPPFSAWKLDVAVTNETPFLIRGNIASGEIIPNLKLGGTLGYPVPEGQIELKDARAYLPFTTMFIKQGWITFDRITPWVPQLEVRGTAEVLDYDVHLYAYGPLSERQMILRSDPPLSQESLILLLTTGFAPGMYSGAGFGEAAIGQGSLLLLRAFARQFESGGVDLDSFINRLQITAQPPRDQFELASLRGRFRLWQGISLMAERDGYGFYNAGVTYSLRFR